VELFAALHAGAAVDHLDWVRVEGWGALGNMVGGVGLVTLPRLVQVGPEKIRGEQPG
jgi:hypothetical protein